MSIRKVKLVPGEYYHIYNRGNNKQEIFLDKEDYTHFMRLLFVLNTTRSVTLQFITTDVFNFNRENTLVSIGAYCLMPNHFHILIKENQERGISKFMQKLSTGYVMYFNKKYKRTGSLFEGKFKSQHASSNRYLKYVYSYIHLNPIKLIDKVWKEKGIQNRVETIKYLNSYQYSSYLDYSNDKRVFLKILSKTDFPNYFVSPNIFKKEIYEWLKLT